MQKAIVIGCPGSGKSTFARKLSSVTGLPLFYLDMLWHKSDESNITAAEFDAKPAEIISKDKWIIDGNYSRTLETRLAKCDTVFLLDYPTEICLAGVESRIGKPRVDMPWVETHFDEEFKQFIAEFSSKNLPHIYELVSKYKQGKEIFVFKSREEAEAYFNLS